ncbi:MAG: hypothetical protein ACO1SV_16175 [Fimbriimonas sp.]
MYEKTEELIEKICARVGETYTGYHTIGAEPVDGEPASRITFHVGDPDDYEARLAGEGGMYHALVGPRRTILQDAGENYVTEYTDITKADLI